MDSQNTEIEVNHDKARLDIDAVHALLKQSFWAANRSRATLIKSIENSFCFGAYTEGKQIAFARVISDTCTFAYLCDVFVDEAYRGRGVAKALLTEIMKHPELQSLRRFTLATTDAHGLYEKFGFVNVEPNRFMEIKRENV